LKTEDCCRGYWTEKGKWPKGKKRSVSFAGKSGEKFYGKLPWGRSTRMQTPRDAVVELPLRLKSHQDPLTWNERTPQVRENRIYVIFWAARKRVIVRVRSGLGEGVKKKKTLEGTGKHYRLCGEVQRTVSCTTTSQNGPVIFLQKGINKKDQ